MFERFTEKAIKVIMLAQEEARRLGHNFVGTEQILLGLIGEGTGVAAKVLKTMGVNLKDARIEVEKIIGRGSGFVAVEIPFTPRAKRVLELSLEEARQLGHNYIGTEHLLLGLIREGEGVAARVLENLGVDLSKVRTQVIRMLGETAEVSTGGSQSRTKTPTLDEFGSNLTQMAAEGKLDPVVGRQKEIERVIQILGRRTKNNPVLIGEPGVGKTAIAEGLAQRIANGDIPDILEDKRVVTLDIGLLVAGTKYRGEFEERLKKIMDEIRSASNVILVIDEVHTLIGAGAAEGAIDAANILKPALARGELQCIGATTLDEYRKHIERDAALERRFQPVMVGEPTVEETIEILRGLRERYEQHHKLKISDEALDAAAKLSNRYISDRYLPDKAIDVMDEAGAFVRLSGAVGRKRIHPVDIEKIVAKMARIPTQSVSTSDRGKLEMLEPRLKEVVYGQDDAIAALVTAIKRSRAGLGIPGKPIGCFLFTGPTGVGKTEVARQVAQILGVEFVRFDMSEYMEKHAVARLIGAPPGYIGFDQGGLLTDAIRKHPHSVLLMDEIEKAHPDLFNILLQVMDHATLTDNNGKKADFRNVILMMTSNAGSREMSTAAIGFGDGRRDSLSRGKKAVEQLFSPEFRNRLDDIIQFNPLTPEIMERVVDKFMKELNGQLAVRRVR
ncbi:ATP-dependent Clp protease ATP-binding subunit, partial [Trichothermofontia sp.]